MSGSETPAMAAISLPRKPAALTTVPATIVPLSVSTSQSPPDRRLRPVTLVCR